MLATLVPVLLAMLMNINHAPAISLTSLSHENSLGIKSMLPVNSSTSSTVAQPTQKIEVIDAQYAADFSNDRILVGASHNIFIGKVIAQIGTKERGVGPETQFSIAVIDNVKGRIQDTVTIDQQGGFKNGKLYVVGDDSLTKGGNTAYLLQPGSTYLFATRYNAQQNWYTLNPYPGATKLISNDTDLSNTKLQILAKSDSRVKALESAYPREILLGADIQHHDALNSFISSQSSSVIINDSSTSSLKLSSDNLNYSSTTSDELNIDRNTQFATSSDNTIPVSSVSTQVQ
ncbi:hypothetical protein BH11PAT2_BH11PAT2_06680 [soil metagenome]